jgi:hypothetical protein
MLSTNTKLIRVVLFIVATIALLNVSLNDRALFKPKVITVSETVNFGAVGQGADTYHDTRQDEHHSYKASPLDGPVKVGIVVFWVITYALLLGVFLRSAMAQTLVFIISIPILMYVWFVTNLFPS